MFEIDKEKFGAFVSGLRKEKGLMQKDLAEKLYVSDKAVSKWERGLSIPDVALLVPLAEILGVTVTELLECRRIPREEALDSKQTEEIVKKVISLSEEEQNRYRPDRRKRGFQLLLCALVGCMEIFLLVLLGHEWETLAVSLFTIMGLMVIFGLYFCVFAKEKLPAYYDENRITAYSDGFLRMNIPGVSFNNRNWGHIIRTGQLWAMIGLVGMPVVYYVFSTFFPEVWKLAAVYILLACVLGGLFIPMIVVAKRYEYEPGRSKPSHRSSQVWLWIGAVVAINLLLFLVLQFSGVKSSGVRMGWVENSGIGNWSASYAYHNGYRQRTIRVEEGTVLHADIISSEGTLGLSVTDSKGNVLWEEETLQTSSFDITLPGTVTVKITGQKHKGSFALSWDG